MKRYTVTAVVLFLAVLPVRAQVPDHLKCYKIKDPVKLAGVLDLNTPQFGPESGCTVSTAKLFCVPATKTIVSAQDKATGLPITPLAVSTEPTTDDRVCYKVKCAAAPADQVVTDQFGSRTLTKLKAAMVCTPAVKGTAYCGNGTIDSGEDCEAGNLNGATCVSEGFESGTLACGAGCSFDTTGCACTPDVATFPASGQTTAYAANKNDGIPGPVAVPDDGAVEAGATLAYADNGNGTITDANTGLTWEKKSDDGGLHDRDNFYRWSGDGTQETIWDWIEDVNAEGGAGFAGFNDWRIPNAKELESILDYERFNLSVHPAFDAACAPGCTVTTCSCTKSNVYWSSSTYRNGTNGAWVVFFTDGAVVASDKTFFNYVRAVRGGS